MVSVLSVTTNKTKKTQNYDFLFKMNEEWTVEPLPILSTPIKRPPRRPQPTKLMLAFECDIPDGQCIPDKDLLSVNGWLNPAGELFACAWQQHTKTVNCLGFDTERDAVEFGYIKLSEMIWQLGRHYKRIVLTEAQLSTINEWHSNNGINDDYFQYQLSNVKE